MMRARGVIIGATAISVAAMVCSTAPWSARASVDDLALNGTYIATSNGERAQRNDSYFDQATVVSTWTITSSCVDDFDCTGQVTSDQGWTAPLVHTPTGRWTVDRDIPNWIPCPDGTAAPGHQRYRFQAIDPATGQLALGSPMLAGEDKTIGPSGACGKNQWLAIKMPFRLQKVE